MKRTNPRKGFDEDSRFIRITWEEALNTIADKMRTHSAQFGPESLLFISPLGAVFPPPPWQSVYSTSLA